MTKPIFIVGTGRSGTRTMFRMLSGMDNVDIHHEYNVLTVQKTGVMYHSKIWSKKKCLKILEEIYSPAIHCSKKAVWIDSSNKCSWIIDLLNEIFPNSKFLFLVRDGRKVVPSFYYKLREEMYDDHSNEIMKKFLLNPKVKKNMPPLEKKYWWYIPVNDRLNFKSFEKYDRFERCCFHWNYLNKLILNQLNLINSKRSFIVKLEDLTKKISTLNKTLDYLEIENQPIFSEYLKTPRNVFHPLNYDIPKKYKRVFDKICSPMMHKFGYINKRNYRVVY